MTPEQLRGEAMAVERMHGETLTVEWRIKQAEQLRAHADALERLKVAETERDSLRKAFVYKECWQYADDAPGVRAECSEKIAAGKPCKECPKNWTAEAIAKRAAIREKP